MKSGLSKKDDLKALPRGRPKSGRVWKPTRNDRHSRIVNVKPLKSSWATKMQQRQEKKLVKEHEAQLQASKAQEKEDKRKRKEENLARAKENAKKAEVVQRINNTAKIKRMKKKQLRLLEKR